jgi:4-hydroxy-tetrahydrodipicolinate reductase
MQDPIRVLILGTGQMGSGIARHVLDTPGLELVGAYGKRRERSGTDVGRAIGLERDLGLAVEADLPALAERTRPDVAVQATCSRLDDAWPEIAILLRQGVSVVSIAEEMAFPACRSPAIAAEMHALALANGTAVVGTGINPGFVLDLLVVTLTGVCLRVDSITATRVNDLSAYGPTVLAAQGVGLTPEAFEAGVEAGTVTGHFGFCESISMIAEALGCAIDRIEQAIEPILSEIRRETPFVTIEPGCVAGTRHTATGYRDGKPFITLVHPQQVRPELAGVETGDSIEIEGVPGLRLTGSPEIPGGAGTVAIAVNMIPRILAAAPGCYTPAELPVPAALLGGSHRLIKPAAEAPRHA